MSQTGILVEDYVDLRDRHSFPTRRSSDLGVPRRRHRLGEPRPQNGVRDAQCRSEEHTSELQSRFDLVCRLLLEKKTSRKRSWTPTSPGWRTTCAQPPSVSTSRERNSTRLN